MNIKHVPLANTNIECTNMISYAVFVCIHLSQSEFVHMSDTDIKRYLREAEEEGGGPDEEGGGCRHRDISAGAKWTGRSRSRDTYSSPNPPTAETRHQRQRERGGRQRER